VLREWMRASSGSAGLAQRSRILLLAAQGHSNTEIGRLVGVSLPTVRLWRSRYGAGGVGGLGDMPRSGRPAGHDETSIIAATLGPPPEYLGVTHWSARLLAHHLGISFATVARIWRRWGLKQWKAETFKFSTDPELEAKIRDVVGLYLDPPAKAVVVCIDEKTRSKPWTAPARSCRSAPGCPRSRRATTSATAQRHCSPGWRSRPAWSPTAATSSTRTSSSWRSSSKSPAPTPGSPCTWSATTTPPTSTPTSRPG
jgi:transposase